MTFRGSEKPGWEASVFLRALLFCLVLSAVPLAGQEIRAGVFGSVTDAQGAVIPKAQIEARHLETNRTERTLTNETGHYALPVLDIGRWTITSSAQGFKKAVREGLELRVGDRVQLDFRMEVGALAEQITVTAEAELLQTASASRGQVVDSLNVAGMPLLGRNPFMLSLLSTGVQWVNALQSRSARPFDNSPGNMMINGGKSWTSEILLDGAPNTNTESDQAANAGFVPSPDATQEFKIQTNTYDAQYGRTGGGTISLTLKAGTNNLHGAFYEYFRNDILNANDFQSNRAGVRKTAFRWNQPGFRLDGPVILPRLYDGRNRTFFMYSWEAVRSSVPYPATSTVPTADQRKGDFSTTLQTNGKPITIYDPFTTTMVSAGRYTRQPFAANRVPSSLMDPVALKILDYLPLPNTAGTGLGLNNLVASPNPRTDAHDQHAVRIDQLLSDAHRFSARFVRGNRHEVNSFNGYPEPASNQYKHRRANQGAGFDVTSTLSPTTVLTTRVSWMRHFFDIRLFSDGFDPTTLGFPTALVRQLPRKFFPRISMTDYTQFGAGRNIGSEFTRSGVLSFSEALNRIMGKHSLKLGGEWRVKRDNQDRPTSSFGSFSFTKGFTQADPLRGDAASGNAMASFLMGTPASGSALYNTPPAFQSLYYAAFFQDDWRVTQALTLNLGLRWDYESPISERYDQQNAGFDFNSASPLQVSGLNLKGGLLFTGSGHRLPYKRDLNNVQPRIGLAWQFQSKTVLRAGYGMSYLPTFSPGTMNGFSISTGYVGSLDGGITPGPNRLKDPYPTGLLMPVGRSRGLETLMGQGFTFTNPERAIPKVHSFSFGFERELPWRAVAEVSYVGSFSRQLETSKSINEVSAAQMSEYGTALAAAVPNPLVGKLPGSSANGATVPRSQLLRPFPQFLGLTQSRTTIGKSWYQALQTRLEKRVSGGLHFLVSYTFSKVIDATGYLNSGQNPINALERVVASEDAPHRLVVSGGWKIPFFDRQRGLAGIFLRGWQMNTILVSQSGLPLGMPGGYYSGGIDPALPEGQRTMSRYFNTCTVTVAGVRQHCASPSEPVAFIQQPPYTLRTLSSRITSIRDQRPPVVDFSLFKAVSIREAVSVEFRAESFNLTNTPWFGNPSTSLASASAGLITPRQSNDPRNVQLALRVVF